MKNFLLSLIFCVFLCSIGFSDVDLKLDTSQYLNSDLFTNPLLPNEGGTVKITARVKASIPENKQLFAQFKIRRQKTDDCVFDSKVGMVSKGDVFQGQIEWQPVKNGLYTVSVILDPDNLVKESDEENNKGELLLPVLAKGKKLYFPVWGWQPEHDRNMRWVNCFTVTQPGPQQERLAERGVLALDSVWGGMSMPKDEAKEQVDPVKYRKEFFDVCYATYSDKSKAKYGFGVDEMGGYHNTLMRRNANSSLEAICKVKREMPNRFFAVWHTGAIDYDMIQFSRQGCDLVLWETYCWRALPDELGVNDVYAVIKERLDTLKKYDMLRPVYGNPCTALLALDSCERPDRMQRCEMEQIIRFIRRHCSEMQGIAWYNGGVAHTIYGLKWNKETFAKMEKVFKWADELAFEYFIKPVITFQQESLCLDRDSDGNIVLIAAVSNIGGVDSGEVEIKFYLDGKPIATKKTKSVPAGLGRNNNRSLVNVNIEELCPGNHIFKAEIISAQHSTVLDGSIEEKRFINE